VPHVRETSRAHRTHVAQAKQTDGYAHKAPGENRESAQFYLRISLPATYDSHLTGSGRRTQS
jgi:hypothetical protein